MVQNSVPSRCDTAQSVVVEDQAGDAAVLGQRAGLRA